MKEYYWHLRCDVCSKALKDTSTYSTHRRLCHNRAIQHGNSPHILLLYLSKNQIHIHTDTLVGLQSTSIHVQVDGEWQLAFFLILQNW